MASIVVSGDTSGAITLSAPSVAGTTTVTLPSSTGTMALLQTPSFATTIGVGGTTASASGAGISFPATQSASSDANTLDDYEEGTFTPTITFGGGSTGITYSIQMGRYVKVGSLVMFELYFVLTNKGSSTGTLNILGLPFTSLSNTGNEYVAVSSRLNGMTGLSGAIQGYVAPGTTNIIMSYSQTGSASSVLDTNLTNSSSLMVAGSYATT